jgi:alkanesulfonate monooxygenase SsuD/methylene tetrahydromethanopterin reductase-like flavin-dependent oxidoreductase (luciferase family)
LDSDLAESVDALKQAFDRRHVPIQLGRAVPALVDELKAKLAITRRYRDFLLARNPIDCETRTPSERVRLFAAESVLAEQEGYALEGGRLIPRPKPGGWKPSWIIIGHSALLGDPYFRDVLLQAGQLTIPR